MDWGNIDGFGDGADVACSRKNKYSHSSACEILSWRFRSEVRNSSLDKHGILISSQGMVEASNLTVTREVDLHGERAHPLLGKMNLSSSTRNCSTQAWLSWYIAPLPPPAGWAA
jgi:hypothetical protein